MIKLLNGSASAQYEALLIQLAQAMKAEGKEWASEIRQAMELPERDLNDALLDRFDGLSADLYMLEGKELFEHVEPEQATPEHLGRELKSAWEDRKWTTALALLRKDAPFISQEQRAYLRAIAYENLGQLRAAFAFMDYASRQNPSDVVYRYFCLLYLVALGESEEAVERAQAYADDRTTPPPLLIEAAAVLIQTARDADRVSSDKQIRVALSALMHALSSKTGLDNTPREVIALGYVSLGLCLELLGDAEQAAIAYELTLVVDPRNGDAQQALRGRLAGRNPSARVASAVPKDASEAAPTGTSFQTLKAQQIWLATGSD